MKTLTALLIGCALLSAHNASAAQILAGPIYDPANGHSYYLGSRDYWTNAQTFAASLGGYLVTINDAAENQFVCNAFNSYGEFFIGLNDSAKPGTFVWLDGETSTYRNWAPGEPDHGGGYYPYEDAVSIPGTTMGWAFGGWNDTPSWLTQLSVVETPEPSSLALFGLGIAALLLRRHHPA